MKARCDDVAAGADTGMNRERSRSDAVSPAPARPAATSMGMHYLRYSTANVLVLLAGLISFPVLTRLLDNAEYGVMGYFNTWLMVAVAIAKFGGQHSIVRFYPHDGGERQMQNFSTNLVALPMMLSLAVWLVAALALAGWQAAGQARYSGVFWCVVLLIPVMVVASIIQAVVRASERSAIVMVTKVVGRGLELALVLGFVILIERSAFAVYGGRLLAALLVLGYFVYWARRYLSFSVGAINLAAVGTALLYGLPLMANEFAYMVLQSFDRVLLKTLTGDYAVVGVYTIGYTLAMQVNMFMNATLWDAFVPVANRVYGANGDAAVLALKERMLLPMTYASFGVAVMLLCVGQDLLVGLSSPRNAASGAVFVAVGTVMALFPLFEVAGYGLLLRKRSMLVFALTLGAAALNIAVNFMLIPVYGYMGAAWATVISYGALALATLWFCPRGLRRFPDARTVLTAGAFALLLFATIAYTDLFDVTGPWSRVVIATGLFLLVYALPVLAMDPRLRTALVNWRTVRA